MHSSSIGASLIGRFEGIEHESQILCPHYLDEYREGPAIPEGHGIEHQTYEILNRVNVLSQSQEKIDELKNVHVSQVRESIQKLSQLQREEPRNAAIPLFMALIGIKHGLGEKQVKSWLIEASELPEFDSMSSRFGRQIRETSLKDEKSYLLSRFDQSRIPLPEYTPLLDTIRDILAQDPSFAKVAGQLAALLMRDGLENRGKEEFIHWVAVEYAVGQAILRRAAVHDRKIAEIAAKMPPYKNLMPKEIQSEHEEWKLTITRTDCNAPFLKRKMAKDREELARAKRKGSN